jgi:predicted DNA-binding transcriptional regulator AlpA
VSIPSTAGPRFNDDGAGPALLDINGVRAALGGNRPLHRTTVWRLVKTGKLPAPILVGGSARWLAGEVNAAIADMAAARAARKSDSNSN